MRTYSKSIAAAIDVYLSEKEWHYHFDDQDGAFRFSLCLTGLIKKLEYVIIVRECGYLVLARSPIGADKTNEKMMINWVEFFSRVNNGDFELMGHFDPDLDNGEVRYNYYVHCEGLEQPTVEMIKNSIVEPDIAFGIFAPGMIDIICEMRDPKQAVLHCIECIRKTYEKYEIEMILAHTDKKLKEYEQDSEEESSSEEDDVGYELFPTEEEDD